MVACLALPAPQQSISIWYDMMRDYVEKNRNRRRKERGGRGASKHMGIGQTNFFWQNFAFYPCTLHSLYYLLIKERGTP